MFYQIKKQYGRGVETIFAKFNDLSDAKLFIESKLAADAALNIKVIYRICEGIDVIEEFHPEKNNFASSSSSGSQGQTSTANFRPTPFNVAPRPTGTPQKWIKDDDEKDDETKK
ncbi:MAG: hypothetical protein A3F11_09115 [Gammaproteobacteria bacterium RIFCSPHIGHO2_12_FULL_37_14]|nr:MAG: hypothetical protein A3F11_09115 [Gammaproteobacteria bacterium RIFCSPHIGHO2_12_FULL_37_14]